MSNPIEPVATHCVGCGYPLSDADIAEDDQRCGGCREELAWGAAVDSGVALARELAEEMRGDHEATVERPYGIDLTAKEYEDERRADWEQSRLRGGE
jgi:hypothetical protein